MNILESIGNTSIVRLRSHPNIVAKLEWENPTGSMKDRMALSMIEGAESRGQLLYRDVVGRHAVTRL